MEPFLFYLLRTSVVMLILYGFYKLIFSRVTFYSLNRVALLLLLLVISAMPLFQFNLFPDPKETFSALPQEMLSLDALEIAGGSFIEQSNDIQWMTGIVIFYFTGLAFFLIRYLWGLFQVGCIVRQSVWKTLDDGSVLCLTDKRMDPFSWFRYIVISQKDYETIHHAILKHEQAHARLHHSHDRMLFDLFACIFWFNPFAWLLVRELRSVHEYQADESVIQQHIDPKQYQLLLIRKSVGEGKFAMANNFFQRDLQKRMYMMMKNRTTAIKKWGYTLIIPVLFLTMGILSIPELNATVVGNQDMPMAVIDNGYLADTLGNNKKELPKQNLIRLSDSTGINPIYIIDGIKKDDLSDVKSDNIESVSVLKGKKAMDIYGDSGKNGVLIITTKKSETDFSKIRKLSQQNQQTFLPPILKNDSLKSQKTFSLSGKRPLFIVDGKRMPKDFTTDSIEVTKIESLNVLKDQMSVERYGEGAEDGVVLIMTKENVRFRVGIDNRDKKTLLRVTVYKTGEVIPFGNFDNAVILINGKKSSVEDIKNLKGDDIKTMSASPGGLGFASDLHQRHQIPADKNIIEIILK